MIFNNTNSTELVGKSALFGEFAEPVVYSNHFTRLRVISEKLEPRFLLMWLVWQWQSGVFERICNRWIGQSAVKNEKLLALEIPTPSLEEQRRLADVFDEHTASTDKIRTGIMNQLAILNQLPAALLGRAFNGEL